MPFALLRKKATAMRTKEDYVEWLSEFGKAAFGVLKESDNLGYKLAEEFFWYNSAKLPSPIEWVNKRKVRVKDSVNTVWWFSKKDDPKADVRQVLVPYSARMKTLLVGPGEVLCTKGKTIWP